MACRDVSGTQRADSKQFAQTMQAGGQRKAALDARRSGLLRVHRVGERVGRRIVRISARDQ